MFVRAMRDRDEDSTATQASQALRVASLMRTVTRRGVELVCRGLYSRHRPAFCLSLGVQADLSAGLITTAEAKALDTSTSGAMPTSHRGPSHAAGGNGSASPKSREVGLAWLPEAVLARLHGLYSVSALRPTINDIQLLRSLGFEAGGAQTQAAKWKAWYMSATPELMNIPHAVSQGDENVGNARNGAGAGAGAGDGTDGRVHTSVGEAPALSRFHTLLLVRSSRVALQELSLTGPLCRFPGFVQTGLKQR